MIGDGKFDGLSVVYASKTNAEVQTGEPERLYTFDEVYDLIDELRSEVNNHKDKIEELENDSKVDEKINELINKDNTNNLFLKMYPVGSIYVTNESANPGSIFGGTWVAFGAGRTIVGVDSTQTEFATVGKTGGEKTHTLTLNEIPSHNHGSKTLTGTFEARRYGTSGVGTDIIIGGGRKGFTGIVSGSGGAWSGSHATINAGHRETTGVYTDVVTINATHTHNSEGGSQAHNNLQPYITVYMWKRTA